MKVWAVKVAYHYGDEKPKDELEIDVKLFRSEQEAIAAFNDIIRNDWTTTIPDGDGEKMLADCPGAYDKRSSIRLSEYYYSKDGKMAWAVFNDCHGYKGEVVELEIDEDAS